MGGGWVADTSIMDEIRKVVFNRLPHTPLGHEQVGFLRPKTGFQRQI